MMALVEASREVADGKLRRLLARNKPFGRTDVQIGSMNRGSTPRWRDPAKILEIGVSGATAKFQSRTFKAARFCARKKAEGVELNPLQARPRPIGVAPWESITLRNEGNGMDVDEEQVDTISSTGAPGDCVHTSPEPMTLPFSPSSSSQVPASPHPSMQHGRTGVLI